MSLRFDSAHGAILDHWKCSSILRPKKITHPERFFHFLDFLFWRFLQRVFSCVYLILFNKRVRNTICSQARLVLHFSFVLLRSILIQKDLRQSSPFLFTDSTSFQEASRWSDCVLSNTYREYCQTPLRWEFNAVAPHSFQEVSSSHVQDQVETVPRPHRCSDRPSPTRFKAP